MRISQLVGLKPVCKLRVTRTGKIYGVTEELGLQELGPMNVHRLSRIEWVGVNNNWWVFSILDQKYIGRGFTTRKAAIEFERSYMDKRLGKIRRWIGV